jgi:hypothetical protein
MELGYFNIAIRSQTVSRIKCGTGPLQRPPPQERRAYRFGNAGQRR